MRSVKQRLVVIVGPTAAGKTSLGIALAQRMGGAVVCADSRQVYAGMNIGTAKPRAAWRRNAHSVNMPEEVNGIAHYLLNIRTPDNQLSLAQWQHAAWRVISRIIVTDRNPLLVGGTMLYADSVVDNYSIPPVPPKPDLRQWLAGRPTDALYEELLLADPAARNFIQPHHKQRIIRALEVIAATGLTFSSLRRRHAALYNVRLIGLFPGWEELKRLLHKRAVVMMQDGLLAETQQLQQRYGDIPLLATLNYRHAAAVLAGTFSSASAVNEMTRDSLRYARRQMAWWRRRKDMAWFTSVTQALAAKDFLTH